MQIKVKHLKNVQFEVEARSHRILCDQPAENHGDDAGLTPPEFLLASLGTCAAYYAVEYLRTRGLDAHSVEVTVDAEKLKPPARLGNFRIRVTSPLALTNEQQQGLSRSVHHCLVHNTLLSPPAISIEFALGEPAQV